MSAVEISISTERTSYLPGEVCTGQASWRADTELDTIEIRLFWYTEGKGDRDSKIVDSIECRNIGRSGTQSFNFTLPREPFSFSGKLISLIWAVEVVAFPGARVARAEFVLGPEGKEVVLPRLS